MNLAIPGGIPPAGGLMARSGLAVLGEVWTGDPANPSAAGLFLRRGRVERMPADPGALPTLRLPPGSVVVPGFVDPHLHLLAAAARRLSVEVGPTVAPDVDSLLARLAGARRAASEGDWIRAAGWDESLTEEGRQPTLSELDAAVPDRPLVIHHATGHAALLNSAALARLGAAPQVQLGPDGLPTGLVAEPAAVLGGVVPPLAPSELRRAVGVVGAELAAAGVVAVGDATHTNDRASLELLAALAKDGVLPQRLVAMVAVGAAAGLRGCGAGPGRGGARFRLGHAKVMPDPAEPEASVAAAVAECGASGWPVAVHCVEVDQLQAALERLAGRPAPPGWRHRLEHLALSLPEQVAAIAGAGLDVVTNPSFRLDRAAKYDRELSGPEMGWLYRHRSLLDAGIRVAASSDAPTGGLRPLASVAAAVGRADGEAVDAAAALTSVTVAAAAVLGPPEDGGPGSARTAGSSGVWPAGKLRPGSPADLVVLDRWPGSGAAADAAAVLATVVDGLAIHESEAVPARAWEPAALARPN